MQSKLIVLDFDGTLADTRSLIVGTMQQVIAHLGLPARTDGQCAAMIGLPLRQTFEQLLDTDLQTASLCEETYRRFFAENNVPGAVALFPAVETTLRKLHAEGHRLTIASSRNHASLMAFLDDFRLTPLIHYVLGADDTPLAKPNPEPVLKTLAHLHEEACHTLVVGDAAVDIQMGRRAGAFTCGVTYGNGTARELRDAGAHFLIDRFAQLPDIIKALP